MNRHAHASAQSRKNVRDRERDGGCGMKRTRFESDASRRISGSPALLRNVQVVKYIGIRRTCWRTSRIICTRAPRSHVPPVSRVPRDARRDSLEKRNVSYMHCRACGTRRGQDDVSFSWMMPIFGTARTITFQKHVFQFRCQSQFKVSLNAFTARSACFFRKSGHS